MCLIEAETPVLRKGGGILAVTPKDSLPLVRPYQFSTWSKDLSYSCVCQTGVSPNVSEYSQTVPFFICQEWGNQCVDACGQDNACSDACRADHPCGAQNPTLVNSSTITATAKPTGTGAAASNAATTTDGAQYTGFGGAAATTAATTHKGAAMAAVDMGRSYGLAIVFSGLFAGFALVL